MPLKVFGQVRVKLRTPLGAGVKKDGCFRRLEIVLKSVLYPPDATAILENINESGCCRHEHCVTIKY